MACRRPFAPRSRVLLYVIDGYVECDGSIASAYETLDFGLDKRSLSLMAGPDGAEFLLLKGRPIDEPVVMGGPFVMNTEAEIEQAFSDYRAGRFGKVEQ